MSAKLIGGLIPVAGYSSRMGMIKPLLKVGQGNIIEIATESLLKAGLSNIYVVLGGYADEIVENYFYKDEVNIVYNANDAPGVFSSIQAGISAFDDRYEAFLMLPVDYPVIRVDTIKKLISAYFVTQKEIIYPVYNKKRGHPCLVSLKYKDEIVSSSPDKGLRTILKGHDHKAFEVEVADENVLLDIDTSAAREYLLGKLPPDSESMEDNARRILQAESLPEGIKIHCRRVAEVTKAIGERISMFDRKINIDLAVAAAMVHDIKRLEKNHAQSGAIYLTTLGYPRIGTVVGAHTGLGINQDRIREKELLYLADKLVLEDEIVGLEKRFAMAFRRYEGNLQAITAINEKASAAQKIKHNIEELIGTLVENVIFEETDLIREEI
jgi:molybdenum cofactor cytidylyltransferase